MVGESNKEQDAVRWDLEDTAAISIPPPFNNGILSQKNLQQQKYVAMDSTIANEMAARLDHENSYSFVGGDSILGGFGTSTTERGVRFPVSSPTNEFENDQLPQEPLQRAHSR